MSQSSAQRRKAALALINPPPAPPQEVEARTYARMDPAVYADFEKQFPMLVGQPKNDGEAQFHAGIEFVLRKLRSKIVVG